jgi:5-methylcytosine-specific restriction endonuclease McrA
MADAIVTRADAKAQGLKWYFTGKPCLRGHIARRNVTNMTCFVCSAEKSKKWYADNKDRHAAYGKQWKQNNPDKVREGRLREYAKPGVKEYRANYYVTNKERFQKQHRDNYLKNRQKRIDYTREWNLRNPEYRRQHYLSNCERDRRRSSEWKKNNPDKVRAWARTGSALRRARVKGLPGQHTPSDLREILKAQGYRCANCRADLRKAKKHVDHIMPLALGGSNDRANIQYLCAPCNLTKAAKDPIAFAREQGRLL